MLQKIKYSFWSLDYRILLSGCITFMAFVELGHNVLSQFVLAVQNFPHCWWCCQWDSGWSIGRTLSHRLDIWSISLEWQCGSVQLRTVNEQLNCLRAFCTLLQIMHEWHTFQIFKIFHEDGSRERFYSKGVNFFG